MPNRRSLKIAQGCEILNTAKNGMKYASGAFRKVFE